MEDVGSGGFETKGIGLWIEAFGPERSVPWPAFVEAIEVRSFNRPGDGVKGSRDRMEGRLLIYDCDRFNPTPPPPTIIQKYLRAHHPMELQGPVPLEQVGTTTA